MTKDDRCVIRKVTPAYADPHDIDPECQALVIALNKYPGICTTDSCSGHGEDPFGIWFTAGPLDALPTVVYWFGYGATGCWGWSVELLAYSVRGPLTFRVRGPVGDYQGADTIAQALTKALGEVSGDK